MQELERHALQETYSTILQEQNKLSKEAADYFADRADESQMKTHIAWYNRTKGAS